METIPYTTRELDMKFQALGEKIDENHKETTEAIDLLDKKNADKQKEMMGFLSEIKSQTLKTNGRVNKLEAWRTGTIMCVAVFTIVVLPLIIYIFNTISVQIRQNSANIVKLQTKSD